VAGHFTTIDDIAMAGSVEESLGPSVAVIQERQVGNALLGVASVRQDPN